jgi:hypothetical protein
MHSRGDLELPICGWRFRRFRSLAAGQWLVYLRDAERQPS